MRDAMISASHALSNVKQAVDALNVFPVPDGDTGTNMSMTIANAARELGRLQNPTATEVADTASSALLRGARGNSGVILSLLFRGFSKGLKGKAEADGNDLAVALGYGVEAAYKAVMKPTEGTILTVAREAAEVGKVAAAENSDPIAVWEAICTEAEASLARTPDLLPQLKRRAWWTPAVRASASLLRLCWMCSRAARSWPATPRRLLPRRRKRAPWAAMSRTSSLRIAPSLSWAVIPSVRWIL